MKLKELQIELDLAKANKITAKEKHEQAKITLANITQSLAHLSKIQSLADFEHSIKQLQTLKTEHSTLISNTHSELSKATNLVTTLSAKVNHIEKQSCTKVVAKFFIENMPLVDFFDALKNIYDAQKAVISSSDFKPMCFARYFSHINDFEDVKPQYFTFVTTLDLVEDLSEIMGIKPIDVYECQQNKRFSLELNSHKYKDFFENDVLNLRAAVYRAKNNG